MTPDQCRGALEGRGFLREVPPCFTHPTDPAFWQDLDRYAQARHDLYPDPEPIPPF